MKKFDPKEPYNNLPGLPPNAELETKAILKKVATARAALAEMKGVGEIIPNQAMLINSLTLREAKDSSEIENIVTTHDELFMASCSCLCHSTLYGYKKRKADLFKNNHRRYQKSHYNV